jgi:hypothetical protein
MFFVFVKRIVAGEYFVDIFLIQYSETPYRQPTQLEPPIGKALKADNLVAHGREHFSDLSFSALMNYDLNDRLIFFFSNYIEAGRPGSLAFQHDSLLQNGEMLFGKFAFDRCLIRLFHFITGV